MPLQNPAYKEENRTAESGGWGKKMPYWIVFPIFLSSTPGAHIEIALSRHSLVT